MYSVPRCDSMVARCFLWREFRIVNQRKGGIRTVLRTRSRKDECAIVQSGGDGVCGESARARLGIARQPVQWAAELFGKVSSELRRYCISARSRFAVSAWVRPHLTIL